MADYDAIIIGTGQAGPALARRLAAAGWNIAIIERKFFGGTCVNTGCTPTKTLVASAYAAHLARRARDYGVTIGGSIGVDMKAVKARKDAVSRPSREGVERSLKRLKGCTVFEGHGRFVGPKGVEVNGEILTADKIFINVGGRALVPPIRGLDQVPYLTNSSMMDVDFLPPHLIVLGGSYVGLEFAQIYRRFGSDVTVIELAPNLIAREDGDVSRAVADILKDENIDVLLNSKVVGVAKQGNNIEVTVENSRTRSQVVGSHLLLAIGRRPNTDDLGLDKTGVATDSRGYIEVDDQLQTNVPGIWALGDCNGRGAFTHTRERSHYRVCPLYRSPTRTRWHDRGRGPQIRPPGTDRDHGHGRREPSVRERRDQGFHEDFGRRGDEADPRCLTAGTCGRRGHSLHPRRDVRQGSMHCSAAGDAHSSHSLGVYSDDVGGPQAVNLAMFAATI